MKGISNERGCKCKDHEFILKPLLPNLHHSKKIQVCFCDPLPKFAKKKVLNSKKKCSSGFPTLNTDKNYATPAFILQNQKEHFLENKNAYLKDHSKKARQYEEVATDLYFPAPRSNYDYCNVCCASYSDYIQHHEQIRLNDFNKHILNLQKTFKKESAYGNRKRSIEQRYIELDDDSDLSTYGHKKIKTEEKTQLTQNMQIFGLNRGPEFKNYYQFNNYMFANPNINCDNPLTEQKLYFNQNLQQNNYQNSKCPASNQSVQINYNHYPQTSNLRQQAPQYSPFESNYMQNAVYPYRYQPDFQHFMPPFNNYMPYLPYQPYHPYLQNTNLNTLRHEHRPVNAPNMMPFMQNPYFCFNNPNISIFTW